MPSVVHRSQETKALSLTSDASEAARSFLSAVEEQQWGTPLKLKIGAELLRDCRLQVRYVGTLEDQRVSACRPSVRCGGVPPVTSCAFTGITA